MVSVTQPQVDIEPTLEFNQKCLDIIFSWNRGEMPFKEAIARLTNYRDEALLNSHIVNQGRAEQLLGYIQHYRGSHNISIQHNERARALYKKAGNRNRVATMDLNQGENYRYKGDFNRALHLYRSAFEHSTQLDTRAMASVNEGLVLLAMGQNAPARRAFEVGYDLVTRFTEIENIQRENLLCEIFHGMAVIHLREKQFEEAWHDALLALEAAERYGEPFQHGFANRTLGEVITALETAPDDRFSSDADDYFRAAIESFREINAEAEIARTMFAQALSQAKRGRRTMAARKLQQVMIIFTQLDMVDDAARAAEAQLAII